MLLIYSSGQISSQTNGFDDVILKVADAISEDCDLWRLGLELGVQNPNISRALQTNWAGGRKTSNGNVMLLQNWAETVKPSGQLPTLRAALKKVGLLEVEETCFTSSCSGKFRYINEIVNGSTYKATRLLIIWENYVLSLSKIFFYKVHCISTPQNSVYYKLVQRVLHLYPLIC